MLRSILIASVAIVAAAPASGQAVDAYKLVVQWGDGMAITGYSSHGRCMEALRAIEAESAHRIADTQRNHPPPAIITSYNVPQGFCIPG